MISFWKDFHLHVAWHISGAMLVIGFLEALLSIVWALLEKTKLAENGVCLSFVSKPEAMQGKKN